MNSAIIKAGTGLGIEGSLELMLSEMHSTTLEIKGGKDANTQSMFPNTPTLSRCFPDVSF